MLSLPRFSAPRVIVCLAAALLVATVYLWMPARAPAAAEAQPGGGPNVGLSRGELIYVPIYSRIYYENGKHTLEMAATLSIHNVNPDRSITIDRTDYYDTEGKLIKKYLDKPVVLAALQTTNVVIEKANTAGGAGANFLVQWHAADTTVSPIVEAVMVNASSNLGIAFTTSGKVVRQVVPGEK